MTLMLVTLWIVISAIAVLCTVALKRFALGDPERIRERYRLLGMTVIHVHPLGVDNFTKHGSNLAIPIRTYEVEVEHSDGVRDVRKIGVQPSLLGRPSYWGYWPTGGKRLLNP